MSSSKSRSSGSENEASVTNISAAKSLLENELGANEMTGGFDEFASDNVNNDATEENGNLWEGSFFGDLDTENLQELPDGTHRMCMSDVNWWVVDPDNATSVFTHAKFKVVWSPVEKDYAGEEVQQVFDIYPRYKPDQIDDAKKIGEVRKAVKKFKGFLKALGTELSGFHPVKFKETYKGIVADLEIRNSYSEKFERNFPNVNGISPVANDGSDSSGGFSDY